MKETLTKEELEIAHALGRISKKEAHDLDVACRAIGEALAKKQDEIIVGIFTDKPKITFKEK